MMLDNVGVVISDGNGNNTDGNDSIAFVPVCPKGNNKRPDTLVQEFSSTDPRAIHR